MITAQHLRMHAVMYARAVAALNNPNFENPFEKAEAGRAADKAGERLEEAARQFVTQENVQGHVDGPETSLAVMVQELSQSLAACGVRPILGSDNPHADRLARASVLVPAAAPLVEEILANHPEK